MEGMMTERAMLRPNVIVVGGPGSGKSHLCTLVTEASRGNIIMEEFPSLSRTAYSESLKVLRRRVRARRVCPAGLAEGTVLFPRAMSGEATFIAWYVTSARWEKADDDTMRVLLRNCDAVIIVIARVDLLLDDIEHSPITDGSAFNDENPHCNGEGDTRNEGHTSAAHNLARVIHARYPRVPIVWCGDPRLSSAHSLWLPPTCHGLRGGHSNTHFRVNRRLCQWTCLCVDKKSVDESGPGICGRSHIGPWPPFGVRELIAQTEAAVRAVCERNVTWFRGSRLRSAIFAWFDKGISQRGIKLVLLIIGLGSLITVMQPSILAKITQPHFGQVKLNHSVGL